MIKHIANKAYQKLRKSIGFESIQDLMDKGYISLSKTKETPTDTTGEIMSWAYRFKFDNPSRKRRFMRAALDAPSKPWDDWVRWMDDISFFKANEESDPEICVEAFCRVPKDQVGRFRHQFEYHVEQELEIIN